MFKMCLEKAISPYLFRTRIFHFFQFLRVRRTKPNFPFFRNGRLSSSTGSAGRHPFAQPRLTFTSQLHRFRSDLAANESNNKNRSTSGESPELSMILDKAQVMMNKQIIKLIDSAVEVRRALGQGTWSGDLVGALRQDILLWHWLVHVVSMYTWLVQLVSTIGQYTWLVVHLVRTLG